MICGIRQAMVDMPTVVRYKNPKIHNYLLFDILLDAIPCGGYDHAGQTDHGLGQGLYHEGACRTLVPIRTR